MFAQIIATACLFVLCTTSLTLTVAAPVPGGRRSALSRRSNNARHFVIYDNLSTSLPSVDRLEGFDTFVLSFWQTTGTSGTAAQWEKLEDDKRAEIKQQYNAAGIKIIVSAFGALNKPTTEGADAIETANALAQWVKDYDLDGVDIDYEDEAAMGLKDGSAETWVITLTTTLREQLPVGDFLLTHAPLATWWSSGLWGDGAYRKVYAGVKDMVDWYNIQYYNAGTAVYESCDSLIQSAVYAKSAILEVSELVPLEKLVILKPGTTSDADNGYMTPEMLGNCLGLAGEKGDVGGAGVWKFSNATDGAWAQSVKASLATYKPQVQAKKNGAAPARAAFNLVSSLPLLTAVLIVQQLIW